MDTFINNELEDIDTDSSIENPSEHNELFDKYTLETFPEPYNSIGQFIMSTISGVAVTYLNKLNNKKEVSYEKDINTYINYCANSPTDNYMEELSLKLHLNLNTESDNNIFKNILCQIKTICINIFNQIITQHYNIFTNYTELNSQELIDTFTKDLLIVLIPMIKYSLISNVITK